MPRAAVLLVATLLCACDTYVPIAERGDADSADWEELPPEQSPNEEVDLLFVIDDTAYMAPIVEALQRSFAQLRVGLQQLAARGRPAGYHVGVVTTDLGAPGIACGFDLGGKLQALGEAKTRPLGCQAPVGARYLAFDQRDGSNNLPTGQTVETTFACMTAVVDPESTTDGHKGCGFEMPLEAAYRALHDPLVENQGFLRPRAILAVVFVGNEDDCSAVDPALFSSSPEYGPLGSYRCARFGWLCDGAPMPEQPQASFAHCEPAGPAQGGRLVDLDQYIDFFTRDATRGGIKANAQDVVLMALSGPGTPVGTEDRPSTGEDCGGSASCVQLRPACGGLGRVDIPVAPALRLPAVVAAAPNHVLSSTCDPDYNAAMDALTAQIELALRPTCFRRPLVDREHPECVVEDRRLDGDLERATPIPRCDAGGQTPCWRLAARDDCAPVCDPSDGSYQRLGIVIDRGGRELGPDTRPYIACRVQPQMTPPNGACMPTVVDGGSSDR